jgi:hypothetical protein
MGLAVDRVVDMKHPLSLIEKEAKEEEAKDRAKFYPQGGGKSAAEILSERAAAEMKLVAEDLSMKMGAAGADMGSSSAGAGAAGAGGEDDEFGGLLRADESRGKAGSGSGSGKKKKADKNVSETVKKKIVNNAALLAAGGKKAIKSWMLPQMAGGSSSSLNASTSSSAGSLKGSEKEPKKRKKKGKGGEDDDGDAGKFDDVGTYLDESLGKMVKVGRTMGVKEMARVTLRDALFCLEREPQMTKSEILYKWWAKIL